MQQIDEELVADEKICKKGAITDMVQPGEKAEEMGECGDDAVWRRVQLQDDDQTVQCRNVVVVGRVQQDGEAGSCDRYKCKSGDDATNGVGQFDKDDEVFVRDDAETGMQDCVRVREGESFANNMCTNTLMRSMTSRTGVRGVREVGDEPGAVYNVGGPSMMDMPITNVRGPRPGPRPWLSRSSSRSTACSGRKRSSSPSPLRRTSTGRVRRTRPTLTPTGDLFV